MVGMFGLPHRDMQMTQVGSLQHRKGESNAPRNLKRTGVFFLLFEALWQCGRRGWDVSKQLQQVAPALSSVLPGETLILFASLSHLKLEFFPGEQAPQFCSEVSVLHTLSASFI